MVNVQLVVLPGLQGLVQVQVTLDRVVLQDVAPVREKGSRRALGGALCTPPLRTQPISLIPAWALTDV